MEQLVQLGGATVICRRRGQSGSALLLVLGAVTLTSLVVLALLGLSLASLGLARARAEVAAEQRAADGALEAGVGRLALSTAANPCNDVPQGSSAQFPGATDGSDPLTVDVTCEPLPRPPPVPEDASGEVLGGPAVEIVGQRYAGSLAVPAGIATDPTLVHTGSSPLRFESDVSVARGAAAKSTVTSGPAVSATGQYVQGVAGPNGTAAAPCGDLSPSGAQAAVSIDDRDASPECSSAAAAALTPRVGTIFSPDDVVSDRDVPGSCPTAAVVEFQPGRYDAIDTARLNRLFNGSCKNKTFWFRPGKYSFDVNDGAIVPATDRHALVVNDATAKIVFGEPNGWSAANGATPASFPRACNAGRSGASIQLSGRTTFRHRAGRVAICPVLNPVTDTPLPAIVQSASAPSQPLLVSSTRPADGWFPRAYTRCFYVIWVECRALSQTSANAIRQFDTTWTSTGSAPLRSARVRFQSEEFPPVHNARREVKVHVNNLRGFYCQTGYMEGGRTNGQYTEIDLFAESGPGGDCITRLTAAGLTESVFEGAIVTIQHLYRDAGGAVDLGCPVSSETNFGGKSGCGVDLWVGDVQVLLNSTQLAPTAASSADWSPASSAITWDDAAAAVAQPTACTGLGLDLGWWVIFTAAGGDARCRSDVRGTRAITLGGFDPTAGGKFAATDRVESLGIVADLGSSALPTLNWASRPSDETSVRFDLTLAGATSPACSVRQEGFFRSVRSAYVDLFQPGGTCREAVQTMGQLTNASVTMTIAANCLWIGGTRAPVFPPGSNRCDMVRLPELDRLALELTSDSVGRAPAAEVTSGASVSAAAGTSFNVFGDVLVPSLDLDVKWTGAPTDLPIFGGFLSINALASRQDSGGTVGVVCCTPPPVRTLLLQAKLDGRVIGEASLYVGASGSGGVPPDVPSARRKVRVLEWVFCSRSVCSQPETPVPAAVLGAVQTTSTTEPPDPGG